MLHFLLQRALFPLLQDLSLSKPLGLSPVTNMYPLEGKPQEQGLEPSLQLFKVPSAIQDSNSSQFLYGRQYKAQEQHPGQAQGMWVGNKPKDGSKPDCLFPTGSTCLSPAQRTCGWRGREPFSLNE